MSIKNVLSIGSKYVGLYETVPNAKWSSKSLKNPNELSDELLDIMGNTGWIPGWPYCAAFTKAVYMEAYKENPEAYAIIKKLLTPSVMVSYKNCRKYVSKEPTVGSIFLYQKGTGGTGHCGIVKEIKKTGFLTIEGNTSPAPTTAEQDRNGDCITSKTRKLDFTSSSGMHLIGFIDFKFDK
jgi:hypothetical protein